MRRMVYGHLIDTRNAQKALINERKRKIEEMRKREEDSLKRMEKALGFKSEERNGATFHAPIKGA